MEKCEIFESTIRELTEDAVAKRKENLPDEKQRLYAEAQELGLQTRDIVKTLSEDQRRILEDYFVKTNLIADHECQHLYVQGAKDCVELLKQFGVL